MALLTNPSDSQYRIIVYHPQHNRACWLTQEFLLDEQAFYYRSTGAEANLIQQLMEESASQQIDLMRLNRVIIDEADRLADQQLIDAVRWFLANSSAKVTILSRRLLDTLLREPSLRDDICLMPVDRQHMLHDYTSVDRKPHLLEVYALGNGRVKLNGRDIQSWDGHLPRSLFFFLVDHGMVTRDTIFATFWSEMEVADATNVFHVTKRKINEILGIDLMTYASGFYRISPDIELSYDVSHFNTLARDGSIEEDSEAIHKLQHSLDFYNGHFLADEASEWAAIRRAKIKQTATDVVLELAMLYRQQGEDESALNCLLRAATLNLHREDIVRDIMTLCLQLSNPMTGIKTYERLEQVLRDSPGVAPNSELQIAYKKLQRLVTA